MVKLHHVGGRTRAEGVPGHAGVRCAISGAGTDLTTSTSPMLSSQTHKRAEAVFCVRTLVRLGRVARPVAWLLRPAMAMSRLREFAPSLALDSDATLLLRPHARYAISLSC